MKSRPTKRLNGQQTPPEASALATELLILADGRILVHNLTPVFARVLGELNPNDERIQLRLGRATEHAPR